MSIKSEATNKAADVAASLKETAADVKDAAASQAHDVAYQAKGAAADQISGVATALRDAASGLTTGSAAERTLGQIANGFADASESLHGKDLGELVTAASDVARRNPMVFIGGAMLLGFAASRFLKASAPVVQDDYNTDFQA